MILKGFHVGGFGVHRDLRYEAGPGLNVVDGPNEAGKTTLHDFVRGMLFGFRGRDAFHQPLQGGGPGGWLEVEGPEGPIRIERKGPGKKDLRVILPGGAAGGQGDLDALLRRTDAQLFRNVFAFGLDELAGFSILTGPEMEMRLFDSSLSGAGRSASALKARLDAIRKEELSARKGTIRERAAEIGELERQLESAKARGRRHGDLAARERRIGEEIEVAQERRREARARADRFTALVDLWDEEVRRREAEAALVELVPLADARERLAGVEALAAVLQREEGLQRERRQRLETLENAAGEKRAAAIRLLESLGPSWTEARARAVDRSLPRRQRFEALAETLRRAERSHAAARNDLEAATREASRAAANLAEVNEAVAALKAPASTQELVDRGGALAELRAARADREHAARRLEDLRDRRGSAGAVSGGAKTLPAWLGAALFAAAGAVAWIAGEPLAAVLAV
ncbi:MAG TPA: AAA family ATPase, partial [Vulgatibacter sp.]